MPDILYRPFEHGDEPRICRMIDDVWYYHRCSRDPEVVDSILGYYMSEYLSRTNYSEVAVYDGRIVGFLFGRSDSVPCTFSGYEEEKEGCARFLSGSLSGRRELKNARRIRAADDDMLSAHEGRFGGELVTFIVDKSCRGKGIGSRLLRDFKEFLRSNGNVSYCIFTDDYCDVDFYMNLGCHIEETRIVPFFLIIRSKFYLLSADVD